MGTDGPTRTGNLPTTSVTLVDALRRPSSARYDEAWVRFHVRYSPVIYRWFRSNGAVTDDLAAELTQDFHASLVRSIRTFEYEPSKSFRGWLRVCVRHHLVDFFRSRRNDLELGDDSAWLQAAETLDERVQRLFDLELFEVARSVVAGEVAPRDWEIYQSVDEEQESAEEVAERHGVSVGAVHTVRWRVKSRLKQEVGRLELTGEPCRTDQSAGSKGGVTRGESI